MQPIAYISDTVISALGLQISSNSPVYIGEANITHIKTKHPYEYEKYYCDIGNIINNPDYVGLSPKDGSLLFVKLYKVSNEYIRVAVKASSHGTYYARTLHLLSTCNAERYIEKGTLKKLDK